MLHETELLTRHFISAYAEAVATDQLKDEGELQGAEKRVSDYLDARRALVEHCLSTYDEFGEFDENRLTREISVLEKIAGDAREGLRLGIPESERKTVEDGLKSLEAKIQAMRGAIVDRGRLRGALQQAEAAVPAHVLECVRDRALEAESDIDEQIACKKDVDLSRLPRLPESEGFLHRILKGYLKVVADHQDLLGDPNQTAKKLRDILR